MKNTIQTIVSILLLCQLAQAEKNKNQVELFATQFKWYAEQKNDHKPIKEFILNIKKNTQSFDPDCYYSNKTPCPVASDMTYTQEIDQIALSMAQETQEAFDIKVEKDGKKLRDYGGIAQGYIIDKLLLQKTEGMFLVNFGGDIFTNGDFKSRPQLSIGVPRREEITFASVSMKKGWMLGSTSPAIGSKIRLPMKYQAVKSFDFKKIVLFAKPEFSGARLDSWSTALIVGGQNLLKELQNNKKYEGQWAFMYIDNNDRAICSKNLKCTFSDKLAENFIEVPW